MKMTKALKTLKIASFLLFLSFMGINSSKAGEILHEENAAVFGINMMKVKQEAWENKFMKFPQKLTGNERIQSGPDFFVDEYGQACEFTTDWIKKHGYSGNGTYEIKDGNLEFETGEKGFYFGFGAIPGENTLPSNRFGASCKWHPYHRLRLRMEVEQDVDETEWVFQTNSYFRYFKDPNSLRKFKITGKGKHSFETDIGIGYKLDRTRAMAGFKIQALTPGAKIKIQKISIFPVTVNVYYRKTFNVSAKPLWAYISFKAGFDYKIFINGKLADSVSVYPRFTFKSLDIAPYLKIGLNTIAVELGTKSWSVEPGSWKWNMGVTTPELRVEGVVIYMDGSITNIHPDNTWKCALNAPAGWQDETFDVSKWLTPALFPASVNGRYLNRTRAVSNELKPRHMGLIQVKVAEQEYPVFDYTQTPKFDLRLPLAVEGKYTPQLHVYDAESDSLVKIVFTPSPQREKKTVSYPFSVEVKKVGAYRLQWLLLDKSGKVVEKRDDEMIIVGPIKQTEISLANFEQEFEKRLIPITHIDCSTASPPDTEFLDHSGMYYKPQLGKGRVVTEDGMAYRETGKDSWSYFAYRLHLKEKSRGKPHLVEIIVPDNQTRYIYSGVVETYPVTFTNNGFGAGVFRSTGTCFTGGNYPLSKGKKKLRYIYYPNSLSAAVVVMSGMPNSRAAACEINVYRIEDGLPALKIPDTKRMFGSFNERLWALNVTFGCESVMEQNPWIFNGNPRYGAWRKWYKTFERKIKWLRHQGRNMTAESIYMYRAGPVPSLKHNSQTRGFAVDPVLMMLKMYKHNKIKCLFGFEYVSTPFIGKLKIDNTSDRELWEGDAGIHMVDKYGRQLITKTRGGVNFLHPQMGAYILEILNEIYERYESVGDVAGLLMITGGFWAPGFLVGPYFKQKLNEIDVGYGDFTVSLFEKETGIKLDVVQNDPKRFMKRFELLTGKHKETWIKWRAKKIKEFIEKAAQLLAKKGNKWKVYFMPKSQAALNPNSSPFRIETSTLKERDGHMEKIYKEMGYPLDLYENNSKLEFVIQRYDVLRFPQDSFRAFQGYNCNPQSMSLLKKYNAFFMTNRLNEVDCPAKAAQKWLWTQTRRGAFVLRGVEDNCMEGFVDIMSEYTPQTIIYSWLDCNLETAFGDQLRRFTKAFYVTPQAEFNKLPAEKAKGIIAQTADMNGGKYLRLVNNTPYPLKGYIKADAKRVFDLVYDRELKTEMAEVNKYNIELRPNTILIISLQGLKEEINCSFSMPKNISDKVLKQAELIVNDKDICKDIPEKLMCAIHDNLKRNDIFALYNLLESYEVSSKVPFPAENDNILINN